MFVKIDTADMVEGASTADLNAVKLMIATELWERDQMARTFQLTPVEQTFLFEGRKAKAIFSVRDRMKISLRRAEEMVRRVTDQSIGPVDGAGGG